jgi:hypothetical protein
MPTKRPPRDVPRTTSKSPEAYCATCKQSYGSAREDFIGFRFKCPKEERFCPHVAYVVADLGIKTWLQVEVFFTNYQTRWSPLRWIPWFHARKAKGRVEAYLVSRLFLICGLLVLLRFFHDRSLVNWVCAGISVFLSLDIIASLTSGVFTSRWPAHPLRAILLSLFSFAQLALCFGVMYAIQCADFKERVGVFGVVYFSFVTISTVGYGDISPAPEKTLLRLTVIVEILLGLYFIVVLLASAIQWIGDRPPQPRALTTVLDLPLTPTPTASVVQQ